MNCSFAEFSQALWGHEPFPWQIMLAEIVAREPWPAVVDLPTASGKTACIDIAVYALAAQAHYPLEKRSAPRRIWLVVDRRIVVDEAFRRASELADKLARAEDGPLKEVADRLRDLSGTGRPLSVGRLRGGTLRDDGWARIPSQPAVITSTVDQVGSRLLFRGYGHSLLSAPIFAGLAANDSLIILDEAHCAVPFMQTLQAIRTYRAPAWAEEPLPSPFGFVLMSATPPRGLPSESVFPGLERERALDHPVLHRRLRTSKPAELVFLEPRQVDADPLVIEAAQRAERFVGEGRRRVAIMVNRVRTAREVAAKLQDMSQDRDVVLLTGRIRPLDRDALVDKWISYLKANSPREPERPIVVVATQCLEVGADFSFDALITECASLDALRQRFGRLARLGSDEPAVGAILVRRADIDAKQPDPIYGRSLVDTWKWLQSEATSDREGRLVVDMGVEALERRIQSVSAEDLASLLAPRSDAPVLLPAHLDLLCQTAPAAHPEPDVSLYLHGQPGPSEVSVVWRSDLPTTDTRQWLEIVALCPPVSGEMLQASLWRVRSWLAEAATVDESGDVEGLQDREGLEENRERFGKRIRPCVVWRGRERSSVVVEAAEILPGDVIVVPAAYGIEWLGQASNGRALGREGLDLFELARVAVGQSAVVRLNEAVLTHWLDCPPLRNLVELAAAPAPLRKEIQDAIQEVLDYHRRDEESPPPPPEWWLQLLDAARDGKMVEHPAGGLILVARTPRRSGAEPDLFADDDDLASAAHRVVALEEHSHLVRRAAEKIAKRCLPVHLQDALALAALWHDAGKLDPRFQVLLHQGDEVAAAGAPVPIAKSPTVPTSPSQRRAIREATGLPENFRHEMLSMDLAQRFAALPSGPSGILADLVLHLVASHHGHARPFAPVVADPSPPPVSGVLAGVEIRLSPEARLESPPACRVDSGIPERFWRLTRRYGWWGLAYLEALLRLADWYASNFVVREGGAS